MINMNNKDHIRCLLDKYLSNYVGIANNKISFSYKLNTNDSLDIAYINLPNYEYLIFGKDKYKMSYHLSGYSFNINESLQRLMGERVERYSLTMAHFLYFSKIKSFNECRKTSIEFLDFNYFKKFSILQYKTINSISKKFIPHFSWSNMEKLKFISCINFIDNREYWIPYQIMFMCGHIYDDSIISFNVSTGIAAHVNSVKAFINAYFEAIQIDRFMKFWYYDTNYQKIIIVDEKFTKKYNWMFNGDIEIIFIDLSEPNDTVHSILTIIKSDRFPFFSFGVQGDYDLDNAITRSFMEADAIRKSYLSFYLTAVTQNKSFIFNETIFDREIGLDSNVIYWAINFKKKPQKYLDLLMDKLKTVSYDELYKKNKQLSLNDDNSIFSKIIFEIKHTYKYAFQLEITAPECRDDYRVIKLYIPELLSLFMPQFPEEKNIFIKRQQLTLRKGWMVHPIP